MLRGNCCHCGQEMELQSLSECGDCGCLNRDDDGDENEREHEESESDATQSEDERRALEDAANLYWG